MKPIPRVNFAHLPTPIEFMPRLTDLLAGPELWIKRDDQTGLAFGGNKTRKLEFLIAEAQSTGAKTLVTAGAVQSNHCRQTAAAAAKFGFGCILILTLTEADANSPEASGNYLLDRIFNAEIVWAKPGERDKALQHAFATAQEQGRNPFLIPYGGSNSTGAAGYAFALQELQEQLRADPNIPSPDWICFASSSGGTQAGLVAGAHLFNHPGKILGISIDEQEDDLQKKVAALASEVCTLLGEPQAFDPKEILVNDQFRGAGYGIMGAAEIEAIRTFARTEGILLDPVYTGRAAAGLIALIKRGFFSPGERILFWHTGGTPALFAERYSKLLI